MNYEKIGKQLAIVQTVTIVGLVCMNRTSVFELFKKPMTFAFA